MRLEAVLVRVRDVQRDDLGVAGDAGLRILVHRHLAERRGEAARAAQRDALERHPVGRAGEDHAGDRGACRRQLPEGRAGHGARVLEARVRRDQRLGRVLRRIRPLEERLDHAEQRLRLFRVEEPRHGGLPHFTDQAASDHRVLRKHPPAAVAPGQAPGAAAGRRTVNVLPPPTRLSTARVPPASSTKPLQIASPSPKCPSARERALSAR